MIFLRTGCFCAFFLMLSIQLHAQSPSAQYSDLSQENWFPKQAVLSVYQDSKDRLWIGTNAGLYHYNLSNLINFNLSQKSKGNLLNNSVYAIAEDSDGNILIGTESGIGALNTQSGEITTISKTDETIHKIHHGRSGNIWCLSSSGDVYKLRFDKGKYIYELFASLSSFYGKNIQPSAIYQLTNGNCLVSSNQGLFQIGLFDRKITRVNFPHLVTTIYASNERLYLGTADQGIFSGVLQKVGEVLELKAIQQCDFTLDRRRNYIDNIKALDGKHLIASTPFAVYIFNKNNLKNYHKLGLGLSYQKEGLINALMVDHGRNIWIGSQKGLYKYRQHTLAYDYFEIEPKQFNRSSQVSDLLYDAEREQLLISTSTDGIRTLNLANNQISNSDFPERTIRSMRFMKNRQLLISTSSRVYKADILQNGKLDHQLLYSDTTEDINQALEIFPGEYWLATWNHGIVRFNTVQDPTRDKVYSKISAYLKALNHLFCIEKDDHDNVWIGSRGAGVIKVSLIDGKIKHYKKDQGSNASNRIISIDRDSKGRMWVSTRGDGLLRYNEKTDSFDVFDTAKGLPSNTICSFAEANNGEIWVSTLSGLARYDEDNLLPFQSFGTEDGILSTEFNFNVGVATNNGRVYFGSGSGVYGIHTIVKKNKSKFSVLFTGFTAFGESNVKSLSFTGLRDYLKLNDQSNVIALKHEENNIQISFAALDYTISEKNKYAYRLLGHDQDWKFGKGKSDLVQYYNLPPGDYRFEVRSGNASGNWTPNSVFLSFQIASSYWVGPLAIAIYFIIIVSACIGFYYIRKRWFKLNDDLSREKDEVEKHQKQMVFYTDLSHEIKNRLSLILGPLEEALSGKKVNQNILHNLYGQALRLQKLSDQILNIRKGEYGKFILSASERNITQVLNDVYAEMEPMAILKGLNLEFSSNTTSLNGWIDEELLEIIALNLLSNSIKYSNPGAYVTMKAELQYLGREDIKSNYNKDGNYLFCSVMDTGIGIPQADIKKVLDPFYRSDNAIGRKDEKGSGIGLDLVGRLVFLHKGWLTIESEQNKSTVVNFYIPIDKDQYKPYEIRPDKDSSIVIPAKLDSIGEDIIKPELSQSNGSVDGVEKSVMKKILVAEDDEDMKDLIVSILHSDYIVYSAANGSEALSLAEKIQPDLILSDLVMPTMDGLTFCRSVKEKFPNRHIPFIILTGRNSEEQKLVCFQNQIDDFMEKPFSPELLRWRVKSMLHTFGKLNNDKMEPGTEFLTPASADDKFIQDVISIIDANIDKEYLNVDFMSNEMCMSRATFYRKMDTLLSESPSTYIRKYRLKRAAFLLASKKYSVSEVAYHVGFNDPNYFAKCFQKEFKTSPSSYNTDL